MNKRNNNKFPIDLDYILTGLPSEFSSNLLEKRPSKVRKLRSSKKEKGRRRKSRKYTKQNRRRNNRLRSRGKFAKRRLRSRSMHKRKVT